MDCFASKVCPLQLHTNNFQLREGGGLTIENQVLHRVNTWSEAHKIFATNVMIVRI